MRAVYFQCNFMEAVSVGLVALNDTGMLMYDIVVKAQLHSLAHFRTWLTLSPSIWVASLLKPLPWGVWSDWLDTGNIGGSSDSFLQSYTEGKRLWSHTFFSSFGCDLTKGHQRSSNYSFNLYQPFSNLILTAAVRWHPWAPRSVAVTRLKASAKLRLVSFPIK